MAPIVVQLKARPGEWARIFVFPKPTSASARMGKLRTLVPELEYTARRIEAGTRSALWARYVEES